MVQAEMAMSNPPPFFVWKPGFELGIPDVDPEHRRFFEITDELYTGMVRGDGEDQMRSTRRKLTDYAAHHFSGEERFLAAIGYPESYVQRKEHAWFLHELEGVALKDSESARAVLTFMKNWFLQHILGTDSPETTQWAERTNCVSYAH